MMGALLFGGFIFGFLFDRYLLPMLDIGLDGITNENTLSATLQQQELATLNNDMAIEEAKAKNVLLELDYKAQQIHNRNSIEGNVVGFQHYDREEYYEDDELEYKKK
jgi:hypothetical protein